MVREYIHIPCEDKITGQPRIVRLLLESSDDAFASLPKGLQKKNGISIRDEEVEKACSSPGGWFSACVKGHQSIDVIARFGDFTGVEDMQLSGVMNEDIAHIKSKGLGPVAYTSKSYALYEKLFSKDFLKRVLVACVAFNRGVLPTADYLRGDKFLEEKKGKAKDARN